MDRGQLFGCSCALLFGPMRSAYWRAVSACHKRPPRQPCSRAVLACHKRPPRQSCSRAVSACHEASLARGRFPHVTSIHRAAVSACHKRPPRQSCSRAVSASVPRASLARRRFPHVTSVHSAHTAHAGEAVRLRPVDHTREAPGRLIRSLIRSAARSPEWAAMAVLSTKRLNGSGWQSQWPWPQWPF